MKEIIKILIIWNWNQIDNQIFKNLEEKYNVLWNNSNHFVQKICEHEKGKLK